MRLRSLSSALAFVFVVACGTPADPSGDAGDQAGTDAGEQQVADAGEQSTPDAGGGFDPLNPQTWPNANASGNWTLSGLDDSACGMVLRSGYQGFSRPETGHHLEFSLQMAAQWNQQTVLLQCQLGEGTTAFTCADWTVTMSFGGCLFNGGFRSITGRLEKKASGTIEAEIEGSVFSTGTGSGCPGTAFCGPEDISAIGTVSPLQ